MNMTSIVLRTTQKLEYCTFVMVVSCLILPLRTILSEEGS